MAELLVFNNVVWETGVNDMSLEVVVRNSQLCDGNRNFSFMEVEIVWKRKCC